MLDVGRIPRLDCVTREVTHKEVRWEGYIKHADVQWKTAGILLGILEEAAGAGYRKV